MKHTRKQIVSLLLGFLLLPMCIAATNPISWRLNQNFPNTVTSGINYTVTYTLTSQLPLTMVRPLNIIKSASPSTEFSYNDQCTGMKLGKNQSCTIEIILSPIVVGNKYVQISIAGYDKNIVPLPQLSTTASSIVTSGVVGEPTQKLPSSMQAGNAANYQFTYTNYGDTDATDVILTLTQTTGTVNVTQNTCMNGANPGTIAKNGGICIIEGTFTPTTNSPAVQTVLSSLTFSGSAGSPAQVSTTTTVNASDADIVASLVPPDYLSPLMTPGSEYPVEFLFSNVSGQDVTLTNTGLVTCTASDASDCSNSFTAPVSQCTNGSLQGNPPQACSVTTTFTAPAANDPPITYTLTGSLSYDGAGSPASVSTSGSVLANIPATRIIKVINQCDFTVWYSLNGASVTGYSSAACPVGTSPAATGNCYWNNYVGNSGANQLANGASDLITIPAISYGGIQWSGNISASTGCNGTTCKQASCDNQGGNASCAPSKGFSQPATQAEITMLSNNVDSYDVEVINGFHIPISMTPYYYISADGNTMIPSTADNFSCGIPGNYFAGGGKINGFGSCNWQTVGQTVALPSPTSYYYWVGEGSGENCPCGAGELCGLDNNFNQVCGNFLGYWNPNELCTQSNLPSAIRTTLQCDQSTGFNLQPPDQYNNTYTSLMACPVRTGYTGPTYNSCYKNYPEGAAVNQCCGCVNWWDPTKTIDSVTILANTTSQTCPAGQTDSLWTGNIQQGIQWMKQACPSVYVYPFDDATSKFTCSNSLPGSTNSTSYVITFCPGNSGIPPGVTDGR